MINRCFLFLGMILLCVLGPGAVTVRAQDTGAFSPVIRKNAAGTARTDTTRRKDTSGPVRKASTPTDSMQKKAASATGRIKKTDTLRSSEKTALKSGTRTAQKKKDTALVKKSAVSKPPASPGGTPGPPPPAAPVQTFALPSFASHSFTGFRDFSNYLFAHNALLEDTTGSGTETVLVRPGMETGIPADTLLFYVIAGVLFLLAVIRLAFTKYCSDLFRAFFNPTLSQRQLREQLSQTPFPALMLNLFFTLSTGLYLYLILRHFQFVTATRPMVLIPVFMALIMVIYLVKYAFLWFTGWLFGYPEVTSGYVFTLYMVNKVLGIALLPFILVLAFATPEIASVALNISLILIILLFIYRYFRSYSLVKNQIFFSKFHFFVYLCGFEIAPVLIIGKLVLLWLNGA